MLCFGCSALTCAANTANFWRRKTIWTTPRNYIRIGRLWICNAPAWRSIAKNFPPPSARRGIACYATPTTPTPASSARSLVTLAQRDELETSNATARTTNLTKAVADYDAVLNQTNSAAPLPDLFLERAQAQAELKNFSEAVRGLDDAIKKFGETPSFVLPAIEYERQQGAFTNALQRLDRAQKFFDQESFLALRGEIQLQAGNLREAKNDFADALAALETFSPARRTQSATLEARLRNGLKQATVSPIQKPVQKTQP